MPASKPLFLSDKRKLIIIFKFLLTSRDLVLICFVILILFAEIFTLHWRLDHRKLNANTYMNVQFIANSYNYTQEIMKEMFSK